MSTLKSCSSFGDRAYADLGPRNRSFKVRWPSSSMNLYTSSRRAPPHICSRSPSHPRLWLLRSAPLLDFVLMRALKLIVAADVNLSLLATLEIAWHRNKFFFINWLKKQIYDLPFRYLIWWTKQTTPIVLFWFGECKGFPSWESS